VVGLHNPGFSRVVAIGPAQQKDIDHTKCGNVCEVPARLSYIFLFGALHELVAVRDRIDAVNGRLVSEASLYGSQVIVVSDQSYALAPAETPRQYGVDIGER